MISIENKNLIIHRRPHFDMKENLKTLKRSGGKTIYVTLTYWGTEVTNSGALDWTTSRRLSTSTIFDFQICDVSRALVLHAGFRQRG